jgi:hypothetical protein
MPRRAKPKFHRNSAGVKEFLTSDPGVISLIDGLTDDVASIVESGNWTTSSGEEIPVMSKTAVTDRYVGRVTLAHAIGIPLEAKYGILHEATQAAGLEWGRKSRGVQQ